ncbi:MAG: hypothetical protein WCJ97_09450 [Phycisphaerae bacterium]
MPIRALTFCRWAILLGVVLAVGCQARPPIVSSQPTDTTMVFIRIITPVVPSGSAGRIGIVNLAGETPAGRTGETLSVTGQPAREFPVEDGWVQAPLPPGKYMVAQFKMANTTVNWQLAQTAWIRTQFTVTDTSGALYLGDVTMAGPRVSVAADERAFYERAARHGYDRARCKVGAMRVME